jgi:hypothetical protein
MPINKVDHSVGGKPGEVVGVVDALDIARARRKAVTKLAAERSCQTRNDSPVTN